MFSDLHHCLHFILFMCFQNVYAEIVLSWWLRLFFIIVFLPNGLCLDLCVILATQTKVFSYSLLSISNFVYAYCIQFHKFLSTFLFAYIFYYYISSERFMLRSLCRFGNREWGLFIFPIVYFNLCMCILYCVS